MCIKGGLCMQVTLLTLLDAITEKEQLSSGLSILFAVIFYIFDIILFFSAYSIRMSFCWNTVIRKGAKNIDGGRNAVTPLLNEF